MPHSRCLLLGGAAVVFAVIFLSASATNVLSACESNTFQAGLLFLWYARLLFLSFCRSFYFLRLFFGSGGNLKRFVLLSSVGVTRADKFPFVILNAFGVLDAKAKGEAAVRQ